MKKYVLLLALVPILFASCEKSNNPMPLDNKNAYNIDGIYFAQVEDTFDCYIEHKRCYLKIQAPICMDSVHINFQDFECFDGATHLYPNQNYMYYSTANNTMYLYADSLKTIPIIQNGCQLSISILGCQLEYKGIIYSKQ